MLVASLARRPTARRLCRLQAVAHRRARGGSGVCGRRGRDPNDNSSAAVGSSCCPVERRRGTYPQNTVHASDQIDVSGGLNASPSF